MKVLLATHNPAKFERYNELLKEIVNLELVSLQDLGIKEKVNEPFTTAKENAIHKAKEYAIISQVSTLAIDEAVKTNFLPEDDQPGVYVRRFADKNKEMTDEEALSVWSKVFEKYPQENKRFIWDFSIAFFNPSNDFLGYIKVLMNTYVANKFSKNREKGYPMSSFLVIDGTERPRADLNKREKLDADKKIFENFLSKFPDWLNIC